MAIQNENNTAVIITETGYGEFGELELIPHFWVADRVVQFSVDMDLPKANDLKNQAGYTASYGNITLRNPLGPPQTNPYFIFGVNNTEPQVFVDMVKPVSS